MPKNVQLNIQAPGTCFSLIILALTQVTLAIKNAVVVACIGQTSIKTWNINLNHSKANMFEVQRYNERK